MNALVLLLPALGLSASPSPPPPAPTPSLVFEARTVDFGETYQFATIEGQFHFTNRGTRPIALVAQPLLRAAAATVLPPVVPPGGSGTISLRVPVGDRLGRTGFRVRVTSDDPGLPEAKLTLTGFVQSAYEPESALVDVGFVARARGGEARLDLSTHEAPSLDVTAVEGAAPWIQVRPLPRPDLGQSVTLAVTIAPGSPLGRQVAALQVHTDLRAQPEYRVRVVASVFDTVLPSENPIDLGLVRVGERKAKSVALTRRDGRPIVIEGVDGVPRELAVSDGPCEPPPATAACRVLTVAASPTTPGPLQARILVRLRDEPEPLPLDVAAIVAGRNAEVRDLGEVQQANGEVLPGEPDAVSPTVAAPPTPMAPAQPPETPGRAEARIVWEATKEEMAFGYLVYRASSRSGPFVRVSPTVIRVPTDGQSRHSYRWVDADLRPGATYFYYVDVVGLGGAKQRFSPVVSKTIAAVPPPNTSPR